MDKSKSCSRDFLGGPIVKNLPSNAGDAGSILVREKHLTYHWVTKPMSCNY